MKGPPDRVGHRRGAARPCATVRRKIRVTRARTREYSALSEV
jgi:hypothetical protein